MDYTCVWDFCCEGVSSDTPMVVDEEYIIDSSALLLHVASSNASAVVDDEESTDFRAPLVSSNTPTMSDDKEISTSTPTGWFDFDEGTGLTDDDEVIVARTIQSFNHNKCLLFSKLITKTDVEKKLIVPTQAMKHFSIPDGKEFADFLVKDLKGEVWNFRLTFHPRPALTDGWLEFVRAKDLVPNDIVTFYKLGGEYRVEVDSEYKL